MNRLYLILIFFISVNLSAQEGTVILSGKIRADSLAIENVHIINKTSNRGTISNKNGTFKITVSENDTIHFSNIQFKTKTMIITKQDLQNGNLNINLTQRANELEEVVIIERKNMAKELSLPNADKKPLDKLERNLNAYSQASLPIVIIATLLGQQGGIDDIYNIVSGNRKRHRKLKKLIDEDKKYEITQENIQIIRDHFKDDFFINTAKIPFVHIDNYIDFCISKEIIELYQKERFLEVMDIFIKDREEYLISINRPTQ